MKLDLHAYRPKINAVELDVNNSPEHEFAKWWCVLLIRNGVPANLLPELIKRYPEEPKFALWSSTKLYLEDFGENYGATKDFEWQRPQVVTEARFKPFAKDYSASMKELKKTNEKVKVELKERFRRRADIFILDTGEIVEIETGKSYDKKEPNVITVRI